MSIRIHKCESVANGCRLTMLPDAQDAVDYLRQECDKQGWKIGATSKIEGTNLLLISVGGPSAAQFRVLVENNPEFDFSVCK